MSEVHFNTDSGTARIIQITDTHIGAEPDFRFDSTDTLASLARVIDAIKKHGQPQVVLVTGDLVHDPVQAAYEHLCEQLLRFDMPVYCLPGNHDDPVIMEQVLNTHNISTAKSLEINNWVVLLLNSFLADNHAGELPSSELEWLAARLQEHAGRDVLIALHHHPVSIDSPWMDGMMLRNPGPFFDVIGAHSGVRAVIWGHIHQAFETEWHGIRLWGTPSTCVQFMPRSNAYQQDEASPGYRSINLLGNGTVESTVVRISY